MGLPHKTRLMGLQSSIAALMGASAAGMRIALSGRYPALFAILAAAFTAVYIFTWNLVLLPNFYVRADLWTPLNVLLLACISMLSGLAVTLSVFSLKANLSFYKKGYGYMAIIPAFLTSACPTCAPLLLSLSSTTFAVGIALAQLGLAVKILTICILSATILYVSSSLAKCGLRKRAARR